MGTNSSCSISCLFIILYIIFFFFKQKTAYERRISDWSSDVCSSDLPVAAARIEHRLQLLDHEGDVAAAAEYRRHHPGQRHGPGVMLGVLRIDEHLEGADAAVLHDVVQRDVHRMFGVRPGDLVGAAEIGRGSCRVRVGQSVQTTVGHVAYEKKNDS